MAYTPYQLATDIVSSTGSIKNYLGAMPFDLSNEITALELDRKINTANHNIIGGKSKTQITGEALATLSLSMRFHYLNCEPALQFKRLKTALHHQKPQSLVFGTGDYLGYWLITHISQTLLKTTSFGRPLLIEAKVNLMEWNGPVTKSKELLAVEKFISPLTGQGQ